MRELNSSTVQAAPAKWENNGNKQTRVGQDSDDRREEKLIYIIVDC